MFKKGHSMNKGKENPMHGKSPWNKGKPWSKEMKEKLSVSHKNSPKCHEWLKKLHKDSKGKHLSPATELKRDRESSTYPQWKGGKYQRKDGYIYIHNPKHPFCDIRGYIAKHRLVMEKKIGRYLKPEEIPHHKGTKYSMNSFKDRGDNRPENLKLFNNRAEHLKFHHSIGDI